MRQWMYEDQPVCLRCFVAGLYGRERICVDELPCSCGQYDYLVED
jgi:hypothetical protein